MPKKTFHISRFEGGMNTDIAPEDIPNNSLLDTLGISVSNIGRIVISGDPHKLAIQQDGTQIENQATLETAGYGLFSFSSDYSLDDAERATEYLVMQSGSFVKIWAGGGLNADEWNALDSGFDMGATDVENATHPSYYAPNGDLRVCDGKFNHANNYGNNPKWFGFTPKKTIGVGTADAIVDELS